MTLATPEFHITLQVAYIIINCESNQLHLIFSDVIRIPQMTIFLNYQSQPSWSNFRRKAS